MIFTTGLFLFTSGCVHQSNEIPGAMAGMNHETNSCLFTPEISVHCGRTPTTAIDNNGRLWVAYVIGEFVNVVYSDDLGIHYSDPVKVNSRPEEIYTNGENRAKIAFGRNGEIYVSWTVVRDGPFYGDIRFSRSLNNGKNFEEARTVNDDGMLTSHRFETLFVDSKGNIYISWLDKRDQVVTLDRGVEYNGAALYYTISKNNGLTFAKNRKVADYSCECCRIAMSETPSGDVAAFWRHIFGDNIRDHGFAVLGLEDIVIPVQRATKDDWQIEACPHHGPAMVTGDDDLYHVTWFTLGEARKGINYGRYNPLTETMMDIRTVATTGSSHPFISRIREKLFLVWKQFDGEKTNIMSIASMDSGETWSAAQIISSTDNASDHPLLITSGEQVWLSWHTSKEGLRIIPLTDHLQVNL
ncbi:MAG: exo-alpha-sialidase [Gammaproteobacteria bacterium]